MKHYIGCLLLVAGMASVSANAALLAGTPGSAPLAGRVSIGEYGLGGANPALQARPFSTGSTAYYLDSISFGSRLYLASGSGDITISVYDNNGTVPGSAVAGGLNLFSATSATINQSLTPTSTITLNANSTYWFVASVDQSGGDTRYWWDLTDSAAFDSDVAGTDMPLASANDIPVWTRYDGSSMHMSIYGTAVPEPGSLALMGIVAGSIWFVRRRMV